MTAKHKWTEEELAIVQRDYAGDRASAQRIASHMGVSFYAVRGQIQRLGLGRQDRRMEWSQEEVEKLRELVPHFSMVTIAKRMGRSVNSVTVKAKRLGLLRRDRFGWFTKREACSVLGVDHHWIQKRIDDGKLRATYHHGHRPCKNGSGSWHISERDLRTFIIEHPEELTGRNVDLVVIVDLLTSRVKANAA